MDNKLVTPSAQETISSRFPQPDDMADMLLKRPMRREGDSLHPQGAIRLLLVEDDPGDTERVKAGLEKMTAVQVTHVVQLKNAVEEAHEHVFDAVLLDLSLPDSGGLETVRQFHEEYPQFPIIVLTGMDDEVGLRAIQAGAHDFIPKDDLWDRLLSRTVRYTIERRRHNVVTDAVNRRVHGLYEEAKAASKSKSEFLANMSHEIRTPMTAILGLLDSLVDADVPEAGRLENVETIRRNGQHLLQIIDDILDLSKIETGKLEIDTLDCSPLQQLVDVYSLMLVRAQANEVDLQLTLDGPVPEKIVTDPVRLRQILLNLVGNAIKFTKNGTVRVVTRLEEKENEATRLRFDVIDSGIGITEAVLGKLFKPFTQADASLTRNYGGTGLGLTISKRLVELLGGEINVTSTPGEGSTFSFTVDTGSLDDVAMIDAPAAEIIEKLKPVATPAKEMAKLTQRVLVAEDNPGNQKVISYTLQKAGADVTLAENGKLAAEMALGALTEDNPFDIVFMDIQMPVMDGYEATRLLRDSNYDGPIVALTSHAMKQEHDKCIAAGCDDYLTKPIDRELLLERVRTCDEIRRRRPEQAAVSEKPRLLGRLFGTAK